MKCPFCDAEMEHLEETNYYMCPGGGRLLTPERPNCPYKNEPMTEAEKVEIEVALIDIEQTD